MQRTLEERRKYLASTLLGERFSAAFMSRFVPNPVTIAKNAPVIKLKKKLLSGIAKGKLPK